MTPQYESVVIDIFYRFFENNFVYKGLRSVYWCIHDKTALAEAEVEYRKPLLDYRLGEVRLVKRTDFDRPCS